jgi:hypothetical protein
MATRQPEETRMTGRAEERDGDGERRGNRERRKERPRG